MVDLKVLEDPRRVGIAILSACNLMAAVALFPYGLPDALMDATHG